MKQLKIFHIFANDINMGDSASALGIKYFLSKNFSGSISFRDKYAVTDLSEDDVDYINKFCDAVVIGGGGLLRGDKKTSKSHILGISFKALNLIKKPIFSYAIGVNYESYFSGEIMGVANYLKERSKLNSVRDHLSKKILENSELTICPSMFILEKKEISNKSKDRIKIGIVPVPLSRVKNPSDYVLKMIGIINDIRQAGHKVKLITHSKFPEDVHYEINKQTTVDLLLPSNPFIAMNFYKEFDIIIGSRGHSLMFATGQLIPFINLSYNVKCDEFCQAINYPQSLSLDSNKIGKCDKINESIDYILKNYAEIQSILFSAKEKARNQNNSYAKNIIKSLQIC